MSEKGADETSLGSIVKELVQNSSAHGLPNIYQSGYLIHRALWTFLFLGGVVAVLWQVSMIILKYRSAPYQVNVDYRFESNLEFPAITICNVNPVLKSQLEKSDSTFRKLFDFEYEPPGPPPIPSLSQIEPESPLQNVTSLSAPSANGTSSTLPPPYGPQSGSNSTSPPSEWLSANSTTTPMNTSTESIPSWDEKEQGDFFRKTSDEYEKRQMLITLLANKTVETKMELGHQLDDMLLSCEWNGYPCSPRNFTSYYHHDYGNCFTFNSKMYNKGSEEEPLIAHKPGPLYGLSLELNAQQHEYMVGMTPTAGFKLVIHDPKVMPFPEDDGISISPGFESSIGVRVLDIQRLGKPWADCATNIQQGNEFKDFYTENYGVKYSMKTCERSCYQHSVISQCGCADPKYPVPNDSSEVEICLLVGSIADEETISCVNDINKEYRKGKSGCENKCPNSCFDRGYTSSISLGMWPSDLYSKTLMDRTIKANREIKRIMEQKAQPLEWITTNIARIQVYYQEFNYEYVQQAPSYGVLDLLSDIGGQLGLWIGVSVLTICEMVQYVGLIVGFLFRKFFLRKNNRVSTPVQFLKPGYKDVNELPV